MRLQMVLLIAIIVIALPGLVWAQAPTASLQGTVQDPSGAVIPSAQVTLISSRTQIHSDTTTNQEGFFLFPALKPDTYTLSVTAPGFRTTSVNNIELIVGADETQLVKLEIGALTVSVTVDASEVRVQTTEASVAREVNMRDIDSLPQLLRTPATLVNFQPGVTVAYGSSFAVVNGTRQGANNVTLDGMDMNFAYQPNLGMWGVGGTPLGINTDSVEEFRIITNGAKAEYGRNGGSQIQMITRSGTNVYHGNLFEYLRNTALNANDFFNNASGVARPELVMNTFGGSVGGYVDIPKVYNGKDRTFFFFNYQGQRVAQQAAVNQTVPTDAARRGIFQWRIPGTGELRSFDIIANDPRHIGIDKQVAATFPLMPLPNNSNIGDGLNTAGLRFNEPLPRVEDQWTAKIDHNFGAAQRLYFRFSHKDYSTGYGAYPGAPPILNNRPGQGFSAGWTSVWKPSLVNEFVAGYQGLGNNWLYGRPKSALFFASSWTSPINSSTDDIRETRVIQISNTLSFQKHKHSFKTGFSGMSTNQHTANEGGIFPNLSSLRAFGGIPAGTIGPNGASVISATDRARFENLYNDLLGRVSWITTTFLSDTQQYLPAGSPRVRNYLYHDYSWFFQNDWRVRKDLTINLGLRWEFFGRPVERDGLQAVLNPAALINTSNQISNVSVQRGSNWYANYWKDFAPRFGFAWNVQGKGKMVIRGSYGIFYDRPVGNGSSGDVDPGTPGFSQTVNTFPNQAAGSDVRLSDNPVLPAPTGTPQLTPADNRSFRLSMFDPNFQTPYVQHFNFSIQWQALRDTVVEAAYVGTRGVRLSTYVNLNQGRISGDFLQAFKEIQSFRANNSPVSAGNTLVRIFGSVNAAVASIGASIFDSGQVGSAAQTLDNTYYTKYAAAGVSDFYIRNYPQFDAMGVSTNNGRSYYDSLQLSVRRRKGALGLSANYTWSKSIDNASQDGSLAVGSAAVGLGFPIDSFNMALGRGLSDYDRTHVFTWTASYALPIGRSRMVGGSMPKWLDQILAGWDVGSVGRWMSGQAMTAYSGYRTAGMYVSTWANYNGSDRKIGAVQKQGNGVTFFTPAEIAQFSFPGAGEIGTSGRNSFRGPGYFDLDLALTKRFRLDERQSVVFRMEAYNLPNHTNFGNPNMSLSSGSFGRITGAVPVSELAGTGRTMQAALRYQF